MLLLTVWLGWVHLFVKTTLFVQKPVFIFHNSEAHLVSIKVINTSKFRLTWPFVHAIHFCFVKTFCSWCSAGVGLFCLRSHRRLLLLELACCLTSVLSFFLLHKFSMHFLKRYPAVNLGGISFLVVSDIFISF